MATSFFGEGNFGLDHIDGNGCGVLLLLDLPSGMTLYFKIPRHELGFYPIENRIKKKIDLWIERRLRSVIDPAISSGD
jgi:hypothetical protein